MDDLDNPDPRDARPPPQTVALMALSWILADAPRAERLLSLTGLTPGLLRSQLNEPAVQAAILDFLAGHEADLLAAADAIGVSPARIAAARDALGGGTQGDRAQGDGT